MLRDCVSYMCVFVLCRVFAKAHTSPLGFKHEWVLVSLRDKFDDAIVGNMWVINLSAASRLLFFYYPCKCAVSARATLLLRLYGKRLSSQWLSHYLFTPIDSAISLSLSVAIQAECEYNYSGSYE